VITLRLSIRAASFDVETKDDMYCNCTDYFIRSRSKK
jgi:hypothetical protein